MRAFKSLGIVFWLCFSHTASAADYALHQLAQFTYERQTFFWSPPDEFIEFGKSLIFAAEGPKARQLYLTDGYAVSEIVVDEHMPYVVPLMDQFFFGGAMPHVYDGDLYFRGWTESPAFASGEGGELYKTNGTEVVKFDVGQGPYGTPSHFTNFAGYLYFVARGPEGIELYKTDGATVTAVVDFERDGVDPTGGVVEFGDEIFFQGNTGVGSTSLYKTNGEQITKVSDLDVSNWGVFRGGMVLTAYRDNGSGIYTTDGTVVTEFDIELTRFGPVPEEFVEYGGEWFFALTTESEGTELYRTDGEKLSLVADIYPGPLSSSPSRLTEFSDELFFNATTPNGRKLFKSDGTSVEEVAEIGFFSDIDYYTGDVDVVFEDHLFFVADGKQGGGIYRTDGNAVDFVPGLLLPDTPYGVVDFQTAGGQLFLLHSNFDDEGNWELYKVVMVPEPSSILQICLGAALLIWFHCRGGRGQ